MLKFTKNSGLTKVWVSLVMTGVYTIDQVPTFFGLKEAVQAVIDELTKGE
ncbi:hypothetical protein [Peptoniphilus genitalis]|uniref:Uncharacterized protein n=1 Tax=Peptoniphilus genitalis TaxID=3036303 RepID=A0ABY4TR82_9FIRM|nr:hypothetical protein [Peptoniphilus sp. SAHP1]URN40921.1 hypothetical protein M9426_06600 [Peptoniphilus sp. SAHP1]